MMRWTPRKNHENLNNTKRKWTCWIWENLVQSFYLWAQQRLRADKQEAVKIADLENRRHNIIETGWNSSNSCFFLSRVHLPNILSVNLLNIGWGLYKGAIKFETWMAQTFGWSVEACVPQLDLSNEVWGYWVREMHVFLVRRWAIFKKESSFLRNISQLQSTFENLNLKWHCQLQFRMGNR